MSKNVSADVGINNKWRVKYTRTVQVSYLIVRLLYYQATARLASGHQRTFNLRKQWLQLLKTHSSTFDKSSNTQ